MVQVSEFTAYPTGAFVSLNVQVPPGKTGTGLESEPFHVILPSLPDVPVYVLLFESVNVNSAP